jgi:hypothetical protein
MAVERRPDGTTRGGNEPPDEVQDTPRQNAGYDAAVRGQRSDEVADEESEGERNADHAGDQATDEGVNRPFRPPADVPRRKGAGG